MTTATESRSRLQSRRVIAALVALAVILTGAVALAVLGNRDASDGTGLTTGSSVEESRGLAEPLDAGVPAAEGPAPDLAITSTDALAPNDLVVTASQEVVVADVAEAARELAAGVAAAGGQVSSEYTTTVGACPEPFLEGTAPVDCGPAPRSTITYRAPLDAVDSLMALAAGLGEESWRTRSATDVGDQIADVDARVLSARASLERLNALMARADTLGDIIALESQIAVRQAELESLLAQQADLADRTAMATVTATLTSAAVAEDEPTGFWGGLQSGLQALASAATAAVTVLGWALPFLVLTAALLFPVLVWRRRRRSASQQPAQPQEAATGSD